MTSLRVGRRKTVLVICTLLQKEEVKVWWYVPSLALKSPRRMGLSDWGLTESTESRSS